MSAPMKRKSEGTSSYLKKELNNGIVLCKLCACIVNDAKWEIHVRSVDHLNVYYILKFIEINRR